MIAQGRTRDTRKEASEQLSEVATPRHPTAYQRAKTKGPFENCDSEGADTSWVIK